MSKAGSDDSGIKLKVGVATGRDLAETGRVLGAWLAERIEGANGVTVAGFDRPKTGGASSETYFVAADVWRGKEVERRDYVLRFQSNVHRLFLRENFAEQVALLRWLGAETDVPVPEVPFFEPDARVLGEPFMMMDRVDGWVPSDVPAYNAGGRLFDATPEQQRHLWSSALAAAARLSRVDAAQMPWIVPLRAGESGLEESMRHWTESMDWASQGRPTPLMLAAHDWLWAEMPSERGTALSHGDCRIGNMIFSGFDVAAIIDWETISLAGPQLDLAHWLAMEEIYTVGGGLAKLPGFGTREETIAEWERLTGLSAADIEWYVVKTSFRLHIITERGFSLMGAEERASLHYADGENMISRQLRRALDRVGVG